MTDDSDPQVSIPAGFPMGIPVVTRTCALPYEDYGIEDEEDGNDKSTSDHVALTSTNCCNKAKHPSKAPSL